VVVDLCLQFFLILEFAVLCSFVIGMCTHFYMVIGANTIHHIMVELDICWLDVRQCLKFCLPSKLPQVVELE
jgi:hypothetical protein